MSVGTQPRGSASGPVRVVQCLSTDVLYCRDIPLTTVAVDDGGDFEVALPVPATYDTEWGSADCRSPEEQCYLLATRGRSLGDGPATVARLDLRFDPDAPLQPAPTPALTVARTSGLGDFQSVTDTNGVADVHLRNLALGTTTLVSANASGTGSGHGCTCQGTVFDPDGTKVAFTASAGGYGIPEDNDVDDVYLRDLVLGSTSIVSVNPSGPWSDGDSSVSAADGTDPFSPDGTQVLIRSAATDLGPADTNGFEDLYTFDLTTHAVTMVTGRAGSRDGDEERTPPRAPGPSAPSAR